MHTSELTLDRDDRREVMTDVTQVSLLRLYALRATYLLLIVGLGIGIRTGIIHHEKASQLMQGVVCCSLAAGSALAASGLRCPLQIL